ncbi:hypothetical protein F2Q69_00027667 [Brassica cretica]|uniref:Uncharacterized protein n=1 Tax=Brassica cretica TaxID=69181 RepID=A0A8S9S5B7_BRACR|nr:hypothetical protein F2Q69_00027667 [Brassica cretica]
MDETTFKRSEADLDQAAGTVDKKTYMRNGVEMAKVEYSTLFQDKKKTTKRLQESVSSDRIRPQPPSEKLEETKSLELMDNVDAYHNDGWSHGSHTSPLSQQVETQEPLDGSHASLLSQQVDTQVYSPNSTQHIEKEPSNQTHAAQTQFFSTNVTQQEPLDGSHTSPLSEQVETQDRNMMRDSIPELLALLELKHPIGSEPNPKEPLDGSHASPLSQQVETQVYSPNSTQHIEKEPSNQTHAAQTQIFFTNVTKQEPLNESPASPLIVSTD